MSRLARAFGGIWSRRDEVVVGFARFPVTILAIAALTAVGNWEVAAPDGLSREVLERISLALVAMIAGSAAAALHLERRGAGYGVRQGASACAGVAAAAAVWFAEPLLVAPPALIGALLLAVPLAPYVGAGCAGFWAFVWRLINTAALAFVTTVVFLAGVSAILASLEYLFDVPIRGAVYGHVWVTGLGFVGPLFALSQIPRQMPAEDAVDRRDLVVAGVEVLSDFVAVPLLAVYAAILHVYGLKIVLTGELPKNQIGWMVLSFGMAVLLLRLAVHPFATFARATTRLFLRFWPFLLPGPLLLLAFAIAIRIGDAGVTPRRYALVLFAVFLALVLAAQAVARLRQDIRIIPALGMAALLLAAAGPWGMMAVSVRSQAERAVAILHAAGALEDGRVARTAALAPADADALRSILRFLAEAGQLDRLAPAFPSGEGNPFAGGRDGLLARIEAAMGLPAGPRGPDRSWTYSARPGAHAAVATGRFDTLVPMLDWGVEAPGTEIALAGSPLTIRPGPDGLTFTRGDVAATLSNADLARLFGQVIAARDGDPAARDGPLLVRAEVDGREVALLFESVSATIVAGAVESVFGRYTLLLAAADWN
ncbi:DUF4153 domain-containing protein [Faunimonas sp. B44]|uniref:DUF4153 domain-containing protein n=1 Tax=Faunimonas sp. B44 TaxID=3461493 RepID=UPI004043AEE4